MADDDFIPDAPPTHGTVSVQPFAAAKPPAADDFVPDDFVADKPIAAPPLPAPSGGFAQALRERALYGPAGKPQDNEPSYGENFVEQAKKFGSNFIPWRPGSDIAQETIATATPALKALNPFSEENRAAMREQAINPPLVSAAPLRTAANVATVAGSPLAGAAHSLLARPYSAITGIPYDQSKEAVDTALSAMAPRGFTARGPLPATPIPAPPTGPLGVTLSEGQATHNLPAIQREQAALRGTSGEKPQALAQEFYDQQRQQLVTAQENLAKSLDPFGQQIAESPQEAGSLISGAVKSESARAKSGVKQAYDVAKALPGEIHASAFDDIGTKIKADLSARPDPVIIDDKLTPYASKAIQDVEERIAQLKIQNRADPLGQPPRQSIVGVNLQGVDQMRRRLSALRKDAYGSGNLADGRATQAVLDAFDAHIDHAINNGLFSGDQRAVQAWNDARAANADYRSTFTAGKSDPIGRVVEKITGKRNNPAAIPNDVADFLYGSSGVNPNSLNVGVAKRIQNILGSNSPEWSGVKQGLFSRLVEPGEGVTGWGPGKIAHRLNKFLNVDGKELAEALYSPAERASLQAYADLLRQLEVPQAGANWSNTATFSARALKAIGGKIGLLAGAALGHVLMPGLGWGVSEAAGAGIAKLAGMAGEAMQARQLARQMPIVTNALRRWQSAVQAQARSLTPPSQAALGLATANLAKSLSSIGIDLRQILQAPVIGRADENQNEVPRPPAQKADGGAVSEEDEPHGTVSVRPYQAALSDTTAINTDQVQPRRDPRGLALFNEEPPETDVTPSAPVAESLFGLGKERYKLWPEKMVESGATLPGDVYSGAQPYIPPGMRREDFTDIPPQTAQEAGQRFFNPVAAEPADPLIERAQDLAGMAGGTGFANVAARGAEREALGSMPVARRGNVDVRPFQQDIRPAKENLADVIDANFDHAKVVGDKTVPIESLSGGSNPQSVSEIARVKRLTDQMQGPGGYIERLITDDAGNVVEGQHRLDALKAMGVKDVPVTEIKDLSRGYDLDTMKKAIKDQGPLPSDHINGLVKNALESIHEYGSPQAALAETEMPGQWNKPYRAALESLLRSDTSEVGAPLSALERGVRRNPNPTQVENLIKRSGEQSLRGLVDDSGVYVWDAAKATHTDAAKELGLNYDHTNRFHIAKDVYGETVLDIGDEWRDPQKILSNPHLVRLLQNDKIVVAEPGMGKITGPEFLNLLRSDSSEVGAPLSAVEKAAAQSKVPGDWYHGTTHDFPKFDVKKGNPENYLGQYPHFTSSPEDASANYAGRGPDLTGRIENLAEKKYLPEEMPKYGTPEYEAAYARAKEQAAAELVGPHEGAVIPAKLNLKNPVNVSEQSPTWLDFSHKYNKDGDVVKESPLLTKLYKSFVKQGEKYGFDGDKAFGEVAESANLYDGEAKASTLDAAMRHSDALSYIDNKHGELIGNHVIANVYKDMGFDGVVMDAKAAFPNMKNIPEGTLHAVPLKQKTVVSKLSGKTLFSDTSEAGAPLSALERQAAANAPKPNQLGFYSAVERAIQNIPQEKAPGPQWLGMLRNRPGVKPEELQWTGLESWLKEQKAPIAKTKVQNFIKNNQVELKEVKGGTLAPTPVIGINGKATGEWRIPNTENTFTTKKEADDWYANNEVPGDLPKSPMRDRITEYVLPGAEPNSYRERLLTLPQPKLSPEVAGKNLYDNFVYRGGGQTWEQLAPETRQHWVERAVEQGQGMDFNPENVYRSSHWDEPNVLAHVRMNDRVIDGKRSLHLEELQSDFMQAHRNEQIKIADAVDKDFDTIADKMVKAGVINKICD